MVEKFKNWLIVNGKSKNTINSYSFQIKKFLKDISISDITKENIYDYILNLKDNYANSSINIFLASLQSFLNFLEKDIKLPKALPIEEKLPVYITREYFENEIINNIKIMFPQNFLKVRAILYFLFYTGIRRTELTSLKRENINLEKRTAKIHIKKTKKEKIVFFTKEVRDMLKAYFSIENESKNAFNTSYESIQYIFDKLKKMLNNNKLTCHVFRHSLATYLRKKGFNIEDIKEILGHKNIQSTMIYAHADIKDIKHKYDKKIK